MIIFGKNSDDKGTQLEILTQTLLGELGYSNITRNEISSGGEEIDVTGEYIIPGLGSHKICKMICECKAYKNVTNMDQWLKFLGKVFVEETRRHEDVFGVFIALSGVNGYVKGNYEDIKSYRHNISIVIGEDLKKLLSQHYVIKDIKDVYKNIGKYTYKCIVGNDICYYQDKVYYLIRFENEETTLVNSLGDPISVEELSRLNEALRNIIDMTKYIDLRNEEKNTQRRFYIRKIIISEFVINNGELPLERLLSKVEGISKAEVMLEGKHISEQMGLTLDEKNVLILPEIDEEEKKNSDIFVKIYRELLNGTINTEVLGCEFYDKHIDINLVEEIRKIQEGLELDSEETKRAIELFKLTPHGLLSFLYPNEMIVTHRRQMTGNDFNEMDKRNFFNTLYIWLNSDYHNPTLYKYFYEVRNIREIETNQEIMVKTSEQIELNVQVPERFMIGRLAEEYGGKLVGLLALKDAPQPWEM